MNIRIIVIVIIVLITGFFAYGLISNDKGEASAFVLDPSTQRTLSQGQVIGGTDHGISDAWLGIPFAQAPVGDLRWRAPKSVPSHDGILEAASVSPVCMQYGSSLSDTGSGFEQGVPTGSEDCLYLNVWAPRDAKNLPVMFWIHGGSNYSGTGGSYNGSFLASKRDVVVVSINYRLGMFGWFSHPEMKNGELLDDSGNYGLLDIIQALQWVQANIGQFGGDTNNVTIFGESAGAFDVLAMMASPLAKDLFHKAISQSGGLNPRSLDEVHNYTDDGGHNGSSAEIINRLLIADGTASDRDSAKKHHATLSGDDLSDYLRSKPATVMMKEFKADDSLSVNVPAVFADGHVVPTLSVEEIFSNPDNHHMVPIILGTNKDETALWMVQNPEHVDFLLGFFPSIKDKSAYERTVKYGGIAWKLRGVDNLARYMTAAGNDSVHAYRFDWDEEPSQFGFDMSFALGAAHGLEIPFVFGNFITGIGSLNIFPQDDAQNTLSNSMTSYWSEFAYTGDPATGRDNNEPQWNAWGEQSTYSIIFDTKNDQGVFMNTSEVTMASLKAEFIADDGFDNPIDKCKIYARTFRENDFILAEYEALDPACVEHPAESF